MYEACHEFDHLFALEPPVPAQVRAAAHQSGAHAGHDITCILRCRAVRAETKLPRSHIACHVPGICCQTSADVQYHCG
eukprot:1364870-Pyramimonas_sp.AAC.1